MITYDIGPARDSFFGLSTDAKPTTRPSVATGKPETIRNGSTFYVMDSKKVYMFDQEHETWILQ